MIRNVANPDPAGDAMPAKFELAKYDAACR